MISRLTPIYMAAIIGQNMITSSADGVKRKYCIAAMTLAIMKSGIAESRNARPVHKSLLA